MPVPIQDVLARPRVATVRMGLEPAFNAFQSLLTLTDAENYSGLGEWAYRTYEALSPDLRRRTRLVMIGLNPAISPTRSWASFPDYLANLSALPAEQLRDRMLKIYQSMPCKVEVLPATPEQQAAEIQEALSSASSYLDFLYRRYDQEMIDPHLETEAYRYVIAPPAMQRLVVSHLHMLWDHYLSTEWERVRPLLQRLVSALQLVDVSGMTHLEVLSWLAGRDLSEEHWQSKLENAERVVFVPNPHLGPYIGKFHSGSELGITFGARLPKGVQIDAPELGRTELLVRLDALADENRLSILQLISREGELRSPDVMQALDLSQSAASRHLKQLTATGYLVERWCDGAKCYDLNYERIEDTLQALRTFLYRGRGVQKSG